MKNLLFLFCCLIVVGLSAQEEDYEWSELDTTYSEQVDFVELELPPLADLSLRFYAPLQTKQHTYTFDIPILNQGVQASEACQLQLIHAWVDAKGIKHQVRQIKTVPALIPGQLYTLRIKIRNASFRQLGHQTQSTFIHIDTLNRIAEQDEGNNIIRYVPGQYLVPEPLETTDDDEYLEVNY